MKLFVFGSQGSAEPQRWGSGQHADCAYTLPLTFYSCTCGSISVTVVLQQCYCRVTAVLVQCYSSVTVVLQQCYCSVTAVLLQCYSRSVTVEQLLIADLRVACISSLYIPHCSRPGTNINDTSVIRKRNLNGQIRQTAVQADWRLCTRGQSDERYEET